MAMIDKKALLDGDGMVRWEHETAYGYRYKMTLYASCNYLEFDVIRLSDHKNVYGLHAEDMPGICGAVVYDEANARFGMAYTSYWESGSVTHFDTLERVKCYSDRNRELKYEVIGNVHDNPYLMMEKDLNIFECNT